MIPFKNRFHGYGSMNYLHKNGETVRTRIFTIKYIPNTRRRFSRIGVVVSKKIDKRAVKRNLIRRRIYNIIHPIIKDFNQNYDLVIIIHSKDIFNIKYQHLEQKIIKKIIEAQIVN